ncbi:hypothetical protein HD806DRAFT_519489 [Xylariaceae sp. AK1471]|nr:hypothetical protein HD806DRAFT_519489 [Xylariaceae sp. AK1471]
MEAKLEPESDHTCDLLIRMHEVEKDAKGLRQLVEKNDWTATETERKEAQLNKLTDSIKQHVTEMAEVMQGLKIIEEAIEEGRQATNAVKGGLEPLAQAVQDLQRDINEIRNDHTKVQPDIKRNTEDITKMKESTANFSRNLEKDIEDFKLAIADIKDKHDTHEKLLARVGPIEKAMDQSTNDNHASDQPPNSQGPEPERPAAQAPPAVLDFVAIYERFKQQYKSKAPEYEPDFIKKFLKRLNVHVSCYFQRYLRLKHPDMVPLVTPGFGQPFPSIFIDLSHLQWMDIRRAINRMKDLRYLQWAFDEGLSGLPENSTLKQGIQQQKESGREPDGEQDLPVPMNRPQRNQHVTAGILSTDELARQSLIHEHSLDSLLVKKGTLEKGVKRGISEAKCDQPFALGLGFPDPGLRPAKKMYRKKS